ncbi:hypothetical protein FM101_08215 [Arthrobacter rhombi]|uniref:Uncharacterized protein n=1 Tax=Arthrobacter rhombi TaxID=71253 RepID=A0A1R4G6Y3_9MICC|nr:hypothetical protein FM101_08215 [Arthrobacter rhombi]
MSFQFSRQGSTSRLAPRKHHCRYGWLGSEIPLPPGLSPPPF